jgi:glycosyltransferase involved in cell wall biosynthesis
LILRKQDVKFDIIHSHGIFPDAYVAIKIGEKFSIPVVCHFHDSYFNRINEKYSRYVKEIIEKASKIIVVSEFQKQTVLNEYPNANNITKIYNGIDGSRFNNLSSGVQKSRFIFIGNLIDVKGLDILIKAICELPEIKLELDVYGQGQNNNLYKKMIEECNLSDKIRFKGTIENEQLPNVLQNYTGLILPSRYETFGIVLIEAMASGLFIIASDVGAIPEIVTCEEYGLLFKSGSAESLKSAIIKSLSINWDRQNISEYGKSFDISITSNKINKLYENLLFKNLDKNEA